VKSIVICGAICIAALALVGCAKNIDTPEAVKQGIIKDIGKKVDVQNMDVSVDAVSFREKEATATVSFRPKGGDRAQSITMTYTMERKGDEWHVKDRNMQRHEQAKPGAPGTAGTAPPIAPGTPMPPNHPSFTNAPGNMPGVMPTQPGSKTNLPPGHPQLNQ
jgi:hypothetical protein